ncbi:MAG: VWA domain-containing protein [Paludisphaera borealis]|uniref:vWA domain-containing protein n=1 Tax=Paludisphaera borealis TaxID=1387353 RepID=UPI00284893CE|nr:vWA domain-containing protein [Paludisphaera borealis]MDR3618641.1 VWA domain-containing protein [Paludisphaera borealis]
MRLSHRSTVALGLALLVAAGGLAAQDAPASKPAPPPAKPKAQPAPGGKAAKAKEKDKTRPQDKAKPKSDPSGETRVLTKAEAEARRRSPFLLPPGASPGDQQPGYDVDDARDEPPWRQAAFFGIRARGRFFIYVVDQSGSMIDDDRLTRATIELRRSVFALQSPQQFEVIFYNDETTTMPGGPISRPADQHNKDLLTAWLRLIDPDGETSPRRAIKQALALRPDAVFLLSDGEFPDGTVEAVAGANTRNIPIHCIDLAGGLAGDHLQRIAHDSGGRYASRPGNLQGGGVPAR